MTLTQCKHCNGAVSRAAKTCPHCGAPQSPGTLTIERILQALPLLLLIYVLAQCSNLLSPPVAPKSAAQSTAPPPAPTAACRADLACWARAHLHAASSACQPLIERHAKYSVRWKYAPDLIFSHYKWTDADHADVQYIGDVAEMQNGFGAWQTVSYHCHYAPDRQQAYGAYVVEGRLPP